MFNKIMEECGYEFTEGTYTHDGKFVPRVTEILSRNINEEYLLKWANSLGFRRLKYADELNKAANIGTHAHNIIEQYMLGNTIYNISGLDISTRQSVQYCIDSFIEWYNDVMPNNKVDIISMEEKLVCPWFGGTMDLFININGKTYLGDFKTSNHVGYRYFLQLAAYKYILKTEKNIDIDGVIILQFSKKNIGYNEYVLMMDEPEHKAFMDLCEKTFLSMVHTHYCKLEVESKFKQLF